MHACSNASKKTEIRQVVRHLLFLRRRSFSVKANLLEVRAAYTAFHFTILLLCQLVAFRPKISMHNQSILTKLNGLNEINYSDKKIASKR